VDSQSDGADPKRDLLEVLVLFFFIVPSVIISFFSLETENPRFPILALSVIFQDLALGSLVFFFLWRNGEPLTRIGWEFSGLKREVALGAGLFLPVVVGVSLIEAAFGRLGASSHMSHIPKFLTAKGPSEIFLACVLVIVVAVTEETIFRGYLLLRFENLTGSRAASVIISSALFALGHAYEGLANVGAIGVLGIILSLIFLWRKSLVSLVVIHLLIDFYPLVLLPMEGIK
jgi:membrane protease YdiL (CAAX protease family)